MMPPDRRAAGGSWLEPAPPSSRARWLFLGVSAALLALILVSGILANRFLGAMHAQESAITRALTERTQMLTSLSLSIQNHNEAVKQLVTQIQVAEEQPPLRKRLDQLTLAIDTELKRYPVERDSAEGELLDGLRDVYLQQRTVYVAMLAKAPDERRRQAQRAAAESLAPLQHKLLDWSSKLQTWNAEKLVNADQARVAEFARTQGRLMRTLAVGLGSGVFLVLAAMAYILRLERQTRHRYLQLAQSRRELQQLSDLLVDAQETERRSISRELHDEVGQSLGALLMDLGRLSATSNDRPEVKTRVENMKAVTERTLHAVRNIALLLRPSMLDDLGLVAALEWQGREVSRRSEIEVDIQAGEVPASLPGDYNLCIYRFVQEALNNAVRHSAARNATVAVRQTPKSIVVVVSDDGRGFTAGRTRGLGLMGMEERVKRLAGTLTVESSPGEGVKLTAELPFPPAKGGTA